MQENRKGPRGRPLTVVMAHCRKRTETFVGQELAQLQTEGVPLRRVSLTASPLTGRCAEIADHAVTPGLDHMHAAALRAAWPPLRRLLRFPRQFLALLRRTGAIHRFAQALTPEDHLHAHFAFLPADVAKIAATHSGASWSIATHAADLFTQPASLLAWRLQGAAFVTSCTGQGVERVRSVAPASNAFLVSHGVTPRPKKRGRQHPPVILGVGRLVAKKGFDVLITALSHLETHNYRCQIIGEGPQRARLEKLIKAQGQDETITLAGALPHEDVREQIASAAMVVLPSRVLPDGDRDGIANVLLEAMATHVPVITTPAGAAAEVIDNEQSGLLVPPDAPTALAQAIDRLLQSGPFAKRLGDRAYQYVIQHRDPQQCIQPLLQRLRA